MLIKIRIKVAYFQKLLSSMYQSHCQNTVLAQYIFAQNMAIHQKLRNAPGPTNKQNVEKEERNL